MTAEPVIIEARQYAEEQARLMADPHVIHMAEGLLYDGGAPKGQALLDWLSSYEGMMTAYNVAQSRLIEFQSIGGPARAIRAILVKKMADAK